MHQNNDNSMFNQARRVRETQKKYLIYPTITKTKSKHSQDVLYMKMLK